MTCVPLEFNPYYNPTLPSLPHVPLVTHVKHVTYSVTAGTDTCDTTGEEYWWLKQCVKISLAYISGKCLLITLIARIG